MSDPRNDAGATSGAPATTGRRGAECSGLRERLEALPPLTYSDWHDGEEEAVDGWLSLAHDAVAEVERLERTRRGWKKDTARAERRCLEVSAIANREHAAVERLRAALREIVDEDARPCPAGRCCVPSFGGGECWSCIARRALEGGE